MAIVAEVADDEERAASHERLSDVVSWLERHGVHARANAIPPMGDPASLLDTLAWEEGCDLIVAGGYGHSRLREWILGGVTHDLLLRSHRCSLLAH